MNIYPDMNNFQLLLPKDSTLNSRNPTISIVIPALNEEITIGEFVDWCRLGLLECEIPGEVLIIDSSTDATSKIALEKGARVLITPKRGLGQAYLDAIPYIRGDFIIMGDCDLTYDFRQIKEFVDSYLAGNEFVMGSRFRGKIEDGAMPDLHRYFGTPLTTWILNKIYKSSFTDIHCGMRGITKNALMNINLTSTGWEYASEMVLKATRIGLKIDEVPVTFYKDREGRLSHHRRAGFWSPWYAGWINLKVMLVYSPDSFLIKPGLIFTAFGLLLASYLSSGSKTVGFINFDTHWMLLGVTTSILGYSLFQVGVIARMIHGLRNGIEKLIDKILTYNKGMILSAILITSGVLANLLFLINFLQNNFVENYFSHLSIYGMLFIILGIQTFGFTLILELFRRNNQKKHMIKNEN